MSLGANLMDDEIKEELLQRLGREQYLLLLALASIDNMETLRSFAALKNAQSEEISRRLAQEPMSDTDRDYTDALRHQYQHASFAVVSTMYDRFLDEVAQAASDVQAKPRRTYSKTDTFLAGVIEGMTFKAIPAKKLLK